MMSLVMPPLTGGDWRRSRGPPTLDMGEGGDGVSSEMTIIRMLNPDAKSVGSGVPEATWFGGEKETRRWRVGYSSVGDLPVAIFHACA